MNPRITGTFIGIIALATLVTAFIVYPHLPPVAASHWNAAGEVNGTMARPWAAFLLPVMITILWGVWALLPNIDPIARGFKGFRYLYDFFWILLTAFLAYVYALSLGANLGWQVNMTYAILPGFAVLFFALGAMMPRIRRNWFFGIRTPWTISDDTVWEATHRLASRLFMFAGAIALFAMFLSPAHGLLISIAAIVLAALVSAVYSYLLYRRRDF